MPHAQRRPQRRSGCAQQPELRTSSAAWLEGVLSMFEAEGIDVPSLLRDAGFDPDSLHRQNTRIPVDEISVLWQLAVARAGKPTLGLARDLAATHSKLGTVGHAMACSADLGAALARLTRYMAVISDATAFSLQREARGCWMVMEHTGGSLPIPRQRVEYALLTVFMQCQGSRGASCSRWRSNSSIRRRPTTGCTARPSAAQSATTRRPTGCCCRRPTWRCRCPPITPRWAKCRSTCWTSS